MTTLVFTLAIAFIWILFLTLSFFLRRIQNRGYSEDRPEENKGMGIKVVFTSGTSGNIRDVTLDRWLRLGLIAAYKPSDAWVEVRRKHPNNKYSGPERRKSQFTVHNISPSN